MSRPQILTAPLAAVAACLGLVLLLATPPAAAQAVKTEIVEAGSIGNSFTVTVTNADNFSPLRDVRIAVVGQLRHIENVAFDQADGFDLAPSARREVTVTFDIGTGVPDGGARETLALDLTAAEGLLDFSRLALHLGIETEDTRLAIVPFVVGQKSAEAERTISGASLTAAIELAPRPDDPTLFDTVAEQAVAAGTIVAAGSVVGLVAFPTGLVAVPEVAGMLLPDATRLIEAAGLNPNVAPLGEAPSEETANRVDHSEPEAGVEVEPESSVSLLAYGPYRPPPEADADGEPPEPSVPAAGLWGQPWRGEIRLSLVVANGRQMSVADAFELFDEEEPEPEEPEEEPSGGILSAPAQAGAAVGEAIVGGVAEGIGEALGAIFKVVFTVLEQGVPLSITLAEEQGGFRLSVPGSSEMVDKANGVIAGFVPLLLPDGGGRLTASKDLAEAGKGKGTLTFTLTAAPDWQQLEVRVGLKGSDMEQGKVRSLELVMTGTAKPGLYPAADYEAEIKARLAKAMAQVMEQARP